MKLILGLNMSPIKNAYFRLRARFDEKAINSQRPFMVRFMFTVRFIEGLYWRFIGKNIVACYGDSHIAPLWMLNGRFANTRFLINSVRGATALGIRNPNSKTNAMMIFERLLQSDRYAMCQLYCLGEVDCAFLIWLLAKKRNEDPYILLDRAVDTYTSFVLSHRRGRVVVVSAPLPTIGDDALNGEIANLRKEVKVSQRERTALTIRFNCLIENWCVQHNCEFIALDHSALDARTGLVRGSLLNQDASDHHYDSEKYIDMLVSSRLQQIFC